MKKSIQVELTSTTKCNSNRKIEKDNFEKRTSPANEFPFHIHRTDRNIQILKKKNDHICKKLQILTRLNKFDYLYYGGMGKDIPGFKHWPTGSFG